MSATLQKITLATAALIISGGMAGGYATEPSGRDTPKPARQVYKNLKVLGALPANQLLPTMQFMAKSLGVECEFCHETERHKDGKRQKQTARKMLRVVYSLNNKNFMRPGDGGGQVTCNSCHRGNQIPGRFKR